MNDRIYLDYAATTPADRAAIAAAMPYFRNAFYNPASAHVLGQAARSAVESARVKCAAMFNCDPDEVVFTSGGTEAVCLGLSAAKKTGRTRVIVSSVEHESALEYAERLKDLGFTVDYVRPDASGVIRPEALNPMLGNDTALVCVMTVNNIVGVIQPVKELARAAHGCGALFFSDAVQAVNTLDIDVKSSNADLVAVSAHKFYGLKGAGALYVRRGVALCPDIVGGGQENGRRAGTHNVPAIVAMGEAAERAVSFREEYIKKVSAARKAFLNALSVGEQIATGERTPDIASVCFNVNAGRLFVALSMEGVCCSVGAACAAGSALPPKTLTEMGVENADKALRFSFGKYTSVASARAAAQTVNNVVSRMG